MLDVLQRKGELAVLLISLVLKLPSVAGTSQPQLLHTCLEFAESLLDSLSDLHDDNIAATPASSGAPSASC